MYFKIETMVSIGNTTEKIHNHIVNQSKVSEQKKKNKIKIIQPLLKCITHTRTQTLIK